MNTKTKKSTEKAEKKTDVITNDKSVPVVETKVETNTPKSKSLIIKLEDLVPFKDHPYKVIENEGMIELTESISEHGILNPLLVRPLEGEDGKYEIISGHRRFFAAQKLSMRKVPCTVHFIDRDAATVMMVDSNCQRTELLPSEKAFAYKMKMDAMSRQGKRTDLKSEQKKILAEIRFTAISASPILSLNCSNMLTRAKSVCVPPSRCLISTKRSSAILLTGSTRAAVRSFHPTRRREGYGNRLKTEKTPMTTSLPSWTSRSRISVKRSRSLLMS